MHIKIDQGNKALFLFLPHEGLHANYTAAAAQLTAPIGYLDMSVWLGPRPA